MPPTHHKQKPKQKPPLPPKSKERQLQRDSISGTATPQLVHSPAASSYRQKLKRMQLPLSPSFDVRNSPLPLLHHTQAQHSSATTPASVVQKRPSTLQLQTAAATSTSTTTIQTLAPPAAAPHEYRYYSPQMRNADQTQIRNYPFHKTRGMRRQSTMSVDSQKVNIAGFQPLPMRQRYKHQEVMFELKSPTNRLTIRECDFGGGGEPCDDDQSIKDSQIFRVSKRNLYMNHRSPWKERDRYSNLYEYSFNIDLNSIIEDAAGSDSS